MEIHLCMEFYQPPWFHPHEMHCRPATLICRFPYSTTVWPTRLMFALGKALYYHYLQFSGTELFAPLASSSTMLLPQRSRVSPLHGVRVVKCIQTSAAKSIFRFHLKDFPMLPFCSLPQAIFTFWDSGYRLPYHQKYCQNRHYLVSMLVVSAKTTNGVHMQGQYLNVDIHSRTDKNMHAIAASS